MLDLLLWGLAGSLAMLMVEAVGRWARWTRMDYSMMMGTMVTADRTTAPLVGMSIHAVMGCVIALGYGLVFERLPVHPLLVGFGLGSFHAAAVLLLVMPNLPGIHPRMASETDGPEATRNLQPPGFLGRNYGRGTMVVTVLEHLVFGVSLGGMRALTHL